MRPGRTLLVIKQMWCVRDAPYSLSVPDPCFARIGHPTSNETLCLGNPVPNSIVTVLYMPRMPCTGNDGLAFVAIRQPDVAPPLAARRCWQERWGATSV